MRGMSSKASAVPLCGWRQPPHADRRDRPTPVALLPRFAVDVVVKPTGSEGTSWSLKDRLGRVLGAIEQDAEGLFQITPEPTGTLKSVPRTHPTLDKAMTAVAGHMHGECALDSQDWG